MHKCLQLTSPNTIWFLNQSSTNIQSWQMVSEFKSIYIILVMRNHCLAKFYHQVGKPSDKLNSSPLESHTSNWTYQKMLRCVCKFIYKNMKSNLDFLTLYLRFYIITSCSIHDGQSFHTQRLLWIIKTFSFILQYIHVLWHKIWKKNQ